MAGSKHSTQLWILWWVRPALAVLHSTAELHELNSGIKLWFRRSPLYQDASNQYSQPGSGRVGRRVVPVCQLAACVCIYKEQRCLLRMCPCA